MHQCPAWSYAKDSADTAETAARIKAFLLKLHADPLGVSEAVLTDARPFHQLLFEGMATDDQRSFIGNFRGASPDGCHPCLPHYNVNIDLDEGMPHSFVDGVMKTLSLSMRRVAGIIDSLHRLDDVPGSIKLYRAVEFACDAFSGFCRVHPFVDGNGHVGRMLVWAILVRYGYYPNGWTIDPRPAGQLDAAKIDEYTHRLRKFRQGDREPMIIDMIGRLGQPPS